MFVLMHCWICIGVHCELSLFGRLLRLPDSDIRLYIVDCSVKYKWPQSVVVVGDGWFWISEGKNVRPNP